MAVSDEGWRDDRADGAGIDPTVSMPPGMTVDGTSAQAGTTPDAIERLPKMPIGKEARPTIVQHHEMKGVRAIFFSLAARPGDE